MHGACGDCLAPCHLRGDKRAGGALMRPAAAVAWPPQPLLCVHLICMQRCCMARRRRSRLCRSGAGQGTKVSTRHSSGGRVQVSSCCWRRTGPCADDMRDTAGHLAPAHCSLELGLPGCWWRCGGPIQAEAAPQRNHQTCTVCLCGPPAPCSDGQHCWQHVNAQQYTAPSMSSPLLCGAAPWCKGAARRRRPPRPLLCSLRAHRRCNFHKFPLQACPELPQHCLDAEASQRARTLLRGAFPSALPRCRLWPFALGVLEMPAQWGSAVGAGRPRRGPKADATPVSVGMGVPQQVKCAASTELVLLCL